MEAALQPAGPHDLAIHGDAVEPRVGAGDASLESSPALLRDGATAKALLEDEGVGAPGLHASSNVITYAS